MWEFWWDKPSNAGDLSARFVCSAALARRAGTPIGAVTFIFTHLSSKWRSHIMSKRDFTIKHKGTSPTIRWAFYQSSTKRILCPGRGLQLFTSYYRMNKNLTAGYQAGLLASLLYDHQYHCSNKWWSYVLHKRWALLGNLMILLAKWGEKLFVSDCL